MIKCIDFAIFGNGYGMAAPYFASTFYWQPYFVVGSDKRRGTFYAFMHGLGAQLISYQWTHPNKEEARHIAGRIFRVFDSERRWGRVRVSWSMSLPADLDGAHAEIRQLKRDLAGSLIGPRGTTGTEG